MENRIKALNILFSASAISIFITVILSIFLPVSRNMIIAIALVGPVITYITGRILCFKEYKD